MTGVHVVDALIGFLLLEWVALAVWRRRRAIRVPALTYRYSLMSGLALVAALRVVLAGGDVLALVACLAVAGVCHAFDLHHRLRSSDAIATR